MLRGMDIPGDRVEEEEGDIEGTSSDGYWTSPPPPPLISCPRLTFHHLLSVEKLERGGRPEKHSIKRIK